MQEKTYATEIEYIEVTPALCSAYLEEWIRPDGEKSLAKFLQLKENQRANLEGANLEGANLIGADLEGANLEGVDLEEANLTGANLTGTNLTGAILTGTNLNGANLEGAILTDANLTKAILKGANLTGANFHGANLNGASLTGANLKGADLTGAILTWAYFHGANLTGANFHGADLTWANLAGADLTGANLTGANFHGADLTWANLTGANFNGANLTGAILTGANLIGADLTGANLGDENAFLWDSLKGTILIGIKGVSDTDLKKAAEKGAITTLDGLEKALTERKITLGKGYEAAKSLQMLAKTETDPNKKAAYEKTAENMVAFIRKQPRDTQPVASLVDLKGENRLRDRAAYGIFGKLNSGKSEKEDLKTSSQPFDTSRKILEFVSRKDLPNLTRVSSTMDIMPFEDKQALHTSFAKEIEEERKAASAQSSPSK